MPTVKDIYDGKEYEISRDGARAYLAAVSTIPQDKLETAVCLQDPFRIDNFVFLDVVDGPEGPDVIVYMETEALDFEVCRVYGQDHHRTANRRQR